MGVLTHRTEVPSVPDKSRFVGLYLERVAYARSGLGLGVCYRRPCRLPFCTRDSISVSTHPSCEIGTRFGSSMDVTSAPLNREPSKIPADTGSMNSLRRTPPEFVPLGMGC